MPRGIGVEGWIGSKTPTSEGSSSYEEGKGEESDASGEDDSVAIWTV